MTADEERKILAEAIEEAMKAGQVPFETRLHHLCSVARQVHMDQQEPKQPCPKCGRALKKSEQGPDGFCLACLKLIFEEKGLRVAALDHVAGL